VDFIINSHIRGETFGSVEPFHLVILFGLSSKSSFYPGERKRLKPNFFPFSSALIISPSRSAQSRNDRHQYTNEPYWKSCAVH